MPSIFMKDSLKILLLDICFKHFFPDHRNCIILFCLFTGGDLNGLNPGG